MSMVYSMAYEPRKLAATEERLDAIYAAARLGLKGDTLALAAGLTPIEFRRLCEFDPAVELAAAKGLADGERELAEVIYKAAQGGDNKAALEILRHVHGWVAKQQVSVDIEQRISISQALEDAKKRLDVTYTIMDADTDME